MYEEKQSTDHTITSYTMNVHSFSKTYAHSFDDIVENLVFEQAAFGKQFPKENDVEQAMFRKFNLRVKFWKSQW